MVILKELLKKMLILIRKNKKLHVKKPISIDKDTLAAKALSIMNEKKLHAYVFMIKKKKNYRPFTYPQYTASNIS